MKLFWFLLGLAIGSVPLGLYLIRINVQLKRIVHRLKLDVPNMEVFSTSSLAQAITTHAKSHQALEQQLEVWKQICQLAPIGFLEVDDENQLIWCNPQARQLLDIQQVDPTKPRLLLELVRSYELDQLIEHTRSTEQPHRQEWTFHPVSVDQSTLSKQQPRPLRAWGFPLANGCIGVFIENRQEAAVLAQQRDRWTSDVAHELKTPLTSIRLVAETLQPRLEPPLRNWVDRLLQETIRLSSLVQDLLDLSQLEARPTPQLVLKTVDLPRLIQSAWSSLEPIARSKSLQLAYEGPESLLIQADEARLHRVLLNLFDNSIKYSPMRQRISVRLSLETSAPNLQQVHLQIIDAGPGFPDSALPFVFERFYRADPSRTRSIGSLEFAEGMRLEKRLPEPPSTQGSFTGGGSGLGLAIVRQIVEAHRGTVQASNHPDAHGAWIQLFLPYLSESE